MLVLTRRPNESIIIANNIKITVVSVGPGRVKLGIEAPANVRVDRQEIHEKIEMSADVLATVGVTDHLHDHQNTIVGSGPDTAVIVTDSADDTDTGTSGGAPKSAVANATAAASPPPLTNKLSKYRLPRKPR